MRAKFWSRLLCLGLAIGWALLAGQEAQARGRARGYIGQEYAVSDFNEAIPASGEHPAGAFNPRLSQYLVAWESPMPDNHQIAARPLLSDGEPAGPASLLSRGSRDQLRPAVVYNPTNREYLVAWMQDASGDGSRYEIWGQRASEAGQPRDSAFLISTDRVLSLWSPRLAWAEAANRYLVAWETHDASETPAGIGMKLLLANGASIAAGTLSTGSAQPESPDVVFNPLDGQYLVVWTQQNLDGTYSLAGARRDLNGSRIGPGPFTIFTSDHYLSNSRAVFHSGAGYGVVFELAFSSYDHDLYLATFDRSAVSFPAPAAIAQTWREERFPQLAAQGNPLDFTIAYRYESSSGSQLWLHSFAGDYGAPREDETLLCDRSGWTFDQAFLAAGDSGILAGYAGGLTGADAHIYARGFWPILTYLPIIQSR